MSEKNAAYHEAGHVILAVASRFHTFTLPISDQDECGSSHLAVSRTKLAAAGKATSPDDMQSDAEIAIETAILFLAGVAAERNYCEAMGAAGTFLEPDRKRAQADFALARIALALADVTAPIEVVEAQALDRVSQFWGMIKDYAEEKYRRQYPCTGRI